MAERKIIHVDMDAFYASVEQRDRPHLRGKPVAVGGTPEGRGVVATASYEARAFGVRSAMSARTALRLCPDLILLPTDFARYRAASRQFMAILERYADALEPLALDEAYLDVSSDPVGLGTATDTAKAIRAEVQQTLGLTCSAGVSHLKFVAKIASGFRKPDGLTVVPPSRVLAFIRPLSITNLWGVGPSTAARLQASGLKTIGDVADLGEVEAITRLGRNGLAWWRMANGRDDRTIGGRGPRKSRSAERTFPEDRADLDELTADLRTLVVRLAESMRAADEKARTLTIKVRFADFETVSRSRTFDTPTQDGAMAGDVAAELLASTEAGDRAVRLLGAGFSNFDQPTTGPQLPLPFGER